jgi:two-component system, NtrC family, sensor histidine kinase HydH
VSVKAMLWKRPLERRQIYWSLAIVAIIVLIDAAQWITPSSLVHWHYALHRLYYLPIVTSGLMLGWPGGIFAALLSGVSYQLRSLDMESPDAKELLDRYLEMLVFCFVGLLTGILSDRERKQRRELSATARRLEEVYRELQNNVGHLQRAARMSALGHLSGGLAHEIRNPLASIDGAAEIVQNEPNNESRRVEFLAIIREECQRLLRLVSNFLDFARPRQPEFLPTEIQGLIDAVVMLVSQTAAKGRVTFDIDVAADLPPVECDAEQVKQVLLNLVLNAVQAMPEGGDVQIKAAIEAHYLVIRVFNSGPPIPQEHVDSVYDPFFTTKETGTGLGLPVAYQIMEQHGGELRLEENGPAGVCFAVTIPSGAKSR